jgi:2-polyprenyl-3-methyl-5-hydroxy-6-metoxy-1,4-benzoquinol methylase
MSKQELDNIASGFSTHGDFDEVISNFMTEIVIPQVKGEDVLEAGCSTGVMTEQMIDLVNSLEVIEGSESYAKQVGERFKGKLKMNHGLFQDFTPNNRYTSVIFAHVLHHIEDAEGILKHIKDNWLDKDGVVHISVPNIESFHRRLGVAMKMNKSVTDKSERNVYFKQPGMYNKQSLIALFEKVGFEVEECYGFLFKPFPHSIMNAMNIDESLLRGLFEMGKENEDLACQLYLRAKYV